MAIVITIICVQHTNYKYILCYRKDIMPLIHHRQLQQHNEWLDDVVEVVAAVSHAVECAVLQKRVAAPQVFWCCAALIVAMEADLVLEDFHANDGKEVVEDLHQKQSTLNTGLHKKQPTLNTGLQ